ncbi:MAG: hypothetical protein AB8H86_09135 [Polyangiales bacterium]
MTKLTKRPKRPALSRAKTTLAATTLVVAVAGCGDDDIVVVGTSDAAPDVTVESDAGPDISDAGNDSAPPPGLMAPDAD